MAATNGGDIEAAQATLREFLDAFERLDIERFMQCWSASATVLHPFPEMPRRIDTLDRLRDSWEAIFAHLRTTGSGPRYVELHPLDLDVRILASDAIVATFHLAREGGVGRRTIVLRK